MKHKHLSILLTMLLSMVGATAFAHDFAVANADGVAIYYVKTSDTEVAVSYQGDSYSDSYNDNPYRYTGNVVIPQSVVYNEFTYSVTSIGTGAFSDCTSLTSITIPNSVTSIDSYAFFNCSSLTSIDIPNSVTSIGQYAFYGCSGLTSVTIGNSVTSIGGGAFYSCSGLTSITIPNSVTSIGSEAFYGCSGLKKVIIPDIASWCGITLSRSDANPLSYAHHLYSDEDTEITELTIPNSVTSIGDWAFYGCSSLTSIDIPNSVTSIGEGAFRSCTNLTSIDIPNSVESIGEYAFRGCSGLTSVTIPNSVTSIEKYAFNDCSGLTSVTIPNSVTSIGNYAFSGCSGLTSIDIPNSVTSIGSSAFSGCSGLTSVTIPNSVTSIGDWAFYGCSSLTTIIIGSGVKSIGFWAFNYCAKLTDVYCYAETVPTAGNSFSNIENTTLHVPSASVDLYWTTNPWSSFKEVVAILEKCATPSISYVGGKLHFDCETEGVTFHYTLSYPGASDNTGNDIAVTSTYTVNVYASKDGYDNSDTATKDINVQGLKGDVNGDGQVTITDAVGVVDIILNEGK